MSPLRLLLEEEEESEEDDDVVANNEEVVLVEKLGLSQLLLKLLLLTMALLHSCPLPLQMLCRGADWSGAAWRGVSRG